MTDAVDLRQLRYFLTLAEELHFGRAAERLGIAQPALSQQVGALERAFGCALLTRKPRVALTEPGRILRREAQQTLARFDRGIAATLRVVRGEAGPLSVGFSASAVLTFFPELVQQYHQRFPDVTLHLRELSAAAEVECVRASAVDVAFIREIAADGELVHEVVVREPLVVLLPRRHPLARSARVRLAALAREPFVHFPREVAPALYDQIQARCQREGFAPRVVQEVREWLTEISLVQAGIGVALVPASFKRLRLGGVSCRPLIGRVEHTSIALCYRREGLSPAAAAFIAMARDLSARASRRA